MSDSGDYLSEMDRNRTADVEVERLLSGSPDPGDNLEPLAGLFAALCADLDDELDGDAVARIVAAAAVASTATPAAAAALPRPGARSVLRRLRRRAATVTVAATVVLGGTSGLAVAADGAMPGDALYGIDRALEAIGVGAGGQQERLGEAAALIDTGEVVRGLEHAAEALDEQSDGTAKATQALMEAADRVRAAGVEPSAVTREGVAGLLTYLAENAGGVDGNQVAELAVQIGRSNDHSNASPSADPASPQEPPGNSPADPPGLTEREPGPPDDVPADPPGQDKAEPGPPDDVPANPPGLDGRDPGPPDSKPNPPENDR